MSLHNEIMNIQHKQGREDFLDSVGYGAYSEGHRDARHAAAELALKYDAEIEGLKDYIDTLEEYIATLEGTY